MRDSATVFSFSSLLSTQFLFEAQWPRELPGLLQNSCIGLASEDSAVSPFLAQVTRPTHLYCFFGVTHSP